MILKPLRDMLFVVPDKVVLETEAGIVLPENRVKRPTSGTILAVGPQVRELKKGDRVVYGEFSGSRETVDFQGEERDLFIMTENDILAVLE